MKRYYCYYVMGAGNNILVKILAYNPKGIYVFLQTLFSWEQNKNTVVVVIQSQSPVQYSCLENPMDRGVWQATVHRVSKSWIFYLHF